MFSGLWEFAVLIGIVSALFLLPRLLKRNSSSGKRIRQPFPLKMRLALVLTAIWVALSMFLTRHVWEARFLTPYLALGVPLLGWGTYWIYLGLREGDK